MKNKEGATAREIIDFLKECLEPDFGSMTLFIEEGPRIGPNDTVHVTYASVPREASRLDKMNALSSGRFVIFAPEGEKWLRGESAPQKLKVEMVSGALYKGNTAVGSEKVRMKAKSGSAEKVVEHLIKFFVDNKALMKREGYEK